MDKQNSKYRWVVFVAVLFSYFIIVSQRTAPGLITEELMKDFKVTASTIGLLTSVQFFAYAILQVPIGILADRFGPNYFLVVGTLLNGIGTFIYSLAPNEWVLLTARLMVGMGDATIWINLVLILSQWFKVKEFVGLLGIAGMTGSFGFLLATVPFSNWIDFVGWREPFFIMGIVLFLTGLLLYYVLVKKPKQWNEPVPGKIAPKREKTLPLLRRIFSNRQAWATFLCHFGLVGTYIGFIGSWAVPFGMNMYGLSRSDSSQLIMVGLFGAIVGAPLTTWISGRVNSIKRPYIMVHIIIFLSWVTFLFFHGNPPLILLNILFFIVGYGNGASTLTFAVVRKAFEVKEVGVVSGFANTGGFISAILLPSLFGLFIDHLPNNAGYQYGFIIPVVFSALGMFGGFLIKEKLETAKQPSLS
ncbi:MFS transporter [Pseudoneobacillus sp. C159]